MFWSWGSAHVDAKRLSRKSIQFKYVTLDKGFTDSNKFRVVKDKKILLTVCNELIGCLNFCGC